MSSAIRLAAPDDGPAVAALVDAAFAPWAAYLGRRPAPMDDDYPRCIADGEVHVAVSDGVPVGMLRLREAGEVLWLETVVVAPGHQGTGLGRQLIAHAEATARVGGFASICLYTHAAMAGNIALYPRLGYVQTGKKRQAGFDRVFFAKALRANA